MSKIILLNGPSGAGKSTTAKALLDRVDGTWAHISQDDIRDLVKKNYRSANGMPDTWDDEIKNQMNASIPICSDIVKRYDEFGINCILDLYAEEHEFVKWQKSLSGCDYQLFILLPNAETTVARNQERSGTARLTDEKVRFNHGNFSKSAWPNGTTVIDSTNLPVSEVAEKIIELI